MTALNHPNEFVSRDILNQFGFFATPEPSFISQGKKPDFWCSGNSELWIEVKTISELSRHVALNNYASRARKRIKQNTALQGLQLDLHLTANENADDHHLRLLDASLLHLCKKVQLTEYDEIYISIPCEEQNALPSRFSITVNNRNLLFLAYVDANGHIPFPHSFHEQYAPIDLMVTVRHPSNENSEHYLMDLESNTDKTCLSVHATKNSNRLKLASMGFEECAHINTISTIRNTLKDANEKFKNAINFRKAPSIVFLFSDGIIKPEQVEIESACFGDLIYQFKIDNMHEGSLLYGRNGVFNNLSSTSGVVLFRGDMPSYFAENESSNIKVDELPFFMG